jgi:hypothetical protein
MVAKARRQAQFALPPEMPRLLGWAEVALSLLLALGSGCVRVSDPCPDGMIKRGRRCVSTAETSVAGDASAHEKVEEAIQPSAPPPAMNPVEAPLEMDDGGATPGMPHTDLSPPSSPSYEAGLPVQVVNPDASDADGRDSGASQEEASTPDPDAATGEGGALEAGVAREGGVACSESELTTWRTLQTSESLNPMLAACYSNDPTCAVGGCNLADCVARTARITSCSRCVEDELLCVASLCHDECYSSQPNDVCRACACRRGCVGRRSNCAMGPVDICRDCSGNWCIGASLDPALIMNLIQGNPSI